MKKLEGKRAIVTGASSGIGEAIARRMGSEGASVTVNFLSNQASAEATVKAIHRAGGRAFAHRADISSPAECREMFAATFERFGGLDVLVANAGIQRDAPIGEMSLSDWQKVIDVNLTGQFVCAQEAIRRFRRCNRDIVGAKGNIIFINSVHQEIPWAGRVNYAAAKGGLKLLMESLAQEVACEKIRVNAIAPGAIKTAINETARDSSEELTALLRLIPYGRIGDPEDVAKAALWLASDDSDYVVGTTLFVDGGMVLYPAFRDGG